MTVAMNIDEHTCRMIPSIPAVRQLVPNPGTPAFSVSDSP